MSILALKSHITRYSRYLFTHTLLQFILFPRTLPKELIFSRASWPTSSSLGGWFWHRARGALLTGLATNPLACILDKCDPNSAISHIIKTRKPKNYGNFGSLPSESDNNNNNFPFRKQIILCRYLCVCLLFRWWYSIKLLSPITHTRTWGWSRRGQLINGQQIILCIFKCCECPFLV